MTVNASANDYTISGAGKITGSTGLAKSGTGMLTVNTTNDFSGAVAVQGGTFKAGSSGALGTAAGETVVNSGATLDVNGQQLNAELITVSDAGVGGRGAIVNSGAQQVNAVGHVTLAGDATFGGTGRWDIRGTGANLRACLETLRQRRVRARGLQISSEMTPCCRPGPPTGRVFKQALTSGGNPFKITKMGTNQVSLVATTVAAALGDVDVQEGVFAIQTTTVSLSAGFW